MKKAKARIPGDRFRNMLKMPWGVSLVSASYDAKNDIIEIVLMGDQLPVKANAPKGQLPEINYDPRPTWTVAGMSAKEK